MSFRLQFILYIIPKYCTSDETIVFPKLTCDYSKINDVNIKEFNVISIGLNLKSIGTYGNGGSGSPTLYMVTTGGKVVNLSYDYNNCGILYDNSEYPIDRIFKLNFYDGVEYSILLENGALINRVVDREHPIELKN